jgi:hypothetical protein
MDITTEDDLKSTLNKIENHNQMREEIKKHAEE